MSKVRIVGRTSPLLATIRANQRAADERVEHYVASLLKPAGAGGEGQPRKTVAVVKANIAGIRLDAALRDVRAMVDAMGFLPPQGSILPKRSRKKLARHLTRNGKLCPWWTQYHQAIIRRELKNASADLRAGVHA